MNILIITIGTRDIIVGDDILQKYFTTEELVPCKNEKGYWLARSLGAKIKEKFPELTGFIQLPIIQPCLDYLRKDNIKIDKLWLVVTDQNTQQERYRESDTIEFVEIIKKMVPIIFLYQSQCPKTVINKIERQVTFLDEVYKELTKNELVKEIAKEFLCIEKIFLLNQGGIDAINTGLLLQLLKTSGEKLVHLSVNEKSKRCIRLTFTEKFLQEREYQQALGFINNFNYGVLDALILPDSVKKLGKYANARLHFDFDEASKILQEMADNMIDREFAMGQLDELNKIAMEEKNESGLIKELYFNARIKFYQQSYVDFLLRFFRIVEFFAQKYTLELLKINNYDHRKWGKTITSYIEQESNEGTKLKDYLDDQKVNGETLDYTKPVIPTFLSIMRYFNHPNLKFLEQIVLLTSLRNKSIGAHDFQPVSLNKIEEILNVGNLNTILMFEKFDHLFNTDFNTQNPFLIINRTIQGILQ